MSKLPAYLLRHFGRVLFSSSVIEEENIPPHAFAEQVLTWRISGGRRAQTVGALHIGPIEQHGLSHFGRHQNLTFSRLYVSSGRSGKSAATRDISLPVSQRYVRYSRHRPGRAPGSKISSS
jgi:hypothetical protein